MIYFYLMIIVQVVIESLPVSSSGHLMLLEKAVTWYGGDLVAQRDLFMQNYAPYLGSIDYMLHGLTALIIVLFFRSDWLFLVRNWRRFYALIGKLVVLTVIADLVTAGCMYVLRQSEYAHMFQWPLYVGLFITAFMLYLLRWCAPLSQNHTHGHARFFNGASVIGYNRSFDFFCALVLGLVQGMAFMPGISRFGAVYVASRFLGFNAHRGFQITWMIFWPLLVAASMKGTYRLVADKVLSTLLTSSTIGVLLIAFIGGYGALCIAARLAYSHRLWWFSGYVAVLACLALFLSN